MIPINKIAYLNNILDIFGNNIKNALLKENVYFVGGAIRDILNDKKDITDIDIVVDEPLEIIKELKKITKFTTVVLDQDFGVYRIYFPEKEIYIDLSKIQGKNIFEDLERRDFSINAIAVRWLKNSFQLIDPFDGIKDIDKRIIKTIKRKNLIDDPLRIIRAFRFNAELGFEIENRTLSFIRELKFLINKSAPERIKFELSKIFQTNQSHKTIRFMYECGIIQEIFPFLSSYKDFFSGKRHVYDLWEHSLKTLENIEKFTLNKNYPFDFDDKLFYMETEKEFNYLTILKISALLHDVGKLFAYDDKGDKITFYRHEIYGADYLSNLLVEKRFSKDTVEAIVKIIRYHMYPFHLVISNNKNLSPRIYLRLKKDLDELVPFVFLLFIADISATNMDRETKSMIEESVKMYNKYLEMKGNDIKYKPLLDGNDVKRILNLQEGPEIGKIIQRLREAQLNGMLHTKEDAENYIKQIYEN